MSVAREEDKEDRQKNGCPSRGLGVAAAAIGVGVGAALYYFFNKRAEQPDTEGSTSDWNCQRPQPFSLTYSSDDSYTTISEHDTTDTSVMNDETQLIDDSFEDPTGLEMSVSDSDDIESVDDFLLSNSDSSVDSDSDYDEFDVTTSSLGIPEDDDRSRSPTTSLLINISLSGVSRVSLRWHSYLTYSSDDSYTTISEHDTTDTSVMNDETQLIDDSFEDPTGLEMSVSDSDDIESVDDFLLSNSDSSVDSDSDYDEFDVTTSSLGIPEDDDRSRSPTTSLLNNISLSWVSRVSPRWHRTHLTEEEQMAMIRQEQFRERSWTLEDCSICFDVMLRNQDVTRLPCAHNFHTECILPWLQEKQTCPICRKNAE